MGMGGLLKGPADTLAAGVVVYRNGQNDDTQYAAHTVCCVDDSTYCEKYYERRPSDLALNYVSTLLCEHNVYRIFYG